MMRFRDPASNFFGAGRSFTLKIALLALVFISVPLILYTQLKGADDRKTQLLRDTVVQTDRLVVEILTPYIRNFRQEQPRELQNTLDRLAASGTNIKILYSPKDVSPRGFFYIASAPVLSSDDLEAERAQLAQLGIFDRIEESCGNVPDLSARFTNPTGREEMLTSLTSVSTDAGCWAIVTSRSGPVFLQVAADKPFWQTTTMQFAAIIYAMSAALIVWLFLDIWRNVSRFQNAAREIRWRGTSGTSFRKINRIPELSGVADDFDVLVGALVESQAMMKRAAEENAHALKASLAIISQSLEPLKRAVPAGGGGAGRSLELIERSVERLDGLVSAVRELDQASADTFYPRRWRMNLSAFVEKLLSAYQNTMVPENKKLTYSIAPDIHVMASQDLLESVVENILENAASFTPPGGTIEVSLSSAGKRAKLVFLDQGPGVQPEHLERIFDRYFSSRAQDLEDEEIGSGVARDHFGLGLWIVKRNVEGVGGTVKAALRDPNGLSLTVDLPTVD